MGARAAESPSADEAFLDGLDGSWVMEGMLGGKPVTYDASGERVLHAGFLRLHMVDVRQPPPYQADVFVGYDAKAHDFVVHWLDQFGAAGARVVATGHRQGNRLVVVFPYAEGAFRDTFTRDVATDTWTLLLESQAPSGSWSTFASYSLHRKSPPAGSTPVVGAAGMERVEGIGGVFFRGRDPQALAAWYEKHLGIALTPDEYTKQAWQQAAGPTAFQPFPTDSTYFGDPSKQWMIDFRVSNLDAMVAQLRAAGIEVTVDARVYPNGRFARLHDPEGNPIELWQPTSPASSK
jgi:glyoxylase I family protein